MKLRLHWIEKCEMLRRYPSFELDSEKYPELELEMVQVHNAGSLKQQTEALHNLETKLNNTTQRGETIMSLFGPWENEEETFSPSYPPVLNEGFLMVSEED